MYNILSWMFLIFFIFNQKCTFHFTCQLQLPLPPLLPTPPLPFPFLIHSTEGSHLFYIASDLVDVHTSEHYILLNDSLRRKCSPYFLPLLKSCLSGTRFYSWCMSSPFGTHSLWWDALPSLDAGAGVWSCLNLICQSMLTPMGGLTLSEEWSGVWGEQVGGKVGAAGRGEGGRTVLCKD